MEDRLATRNDISAVLRNASERTRGEMKVADVTHRDVMLEFRAAMKRREIRSLIHEGEAVALLAWDRGAFEDGVEYLSTSFIGIEKFFQPNVPSVRFGGRLLRRLQRQAGNIMIVSQCYSDHPKVQRWYELMGYEMYDQDETSKSFVLHRRT
ncbi:hypothetical protein [Aureimonas leprariae]|uniref:N-acetyltransferase domain-containing protein n=1 Tax=Plantimonas leprariae TaxID=2615207 RepID=A0A7V7TY66_9HYPH|nr:hypothetical protein [Aureimonas leprariae]KAB0676723.1 hypothetical protein F6X38_20705 [Aureimonas leprariae]